MLVALPYLRFSGGRGLSIAHWLSHSNSGLRPVLDLEFSSIQTIDNEVAYLIVYCFNCIRSDGNSTCKTTIKRALSHRIRKINERLNLCVLCDITVHQHGEMFPKYNTIFLFISIRNHGKCVDIFLLLCNW